MTCEGGNESVAEREDRYDLTVATECSTDEGLGLLGTLDDVIRKEDVDKPLSASSTRVRNRYVV